MTLERVSTLKAVSADFSYLLLTIVGAPHLLGVPDFLAMIVIRNNGSCKNDVYDSYTEQEVRIKERRNNNLDQRVKENLRSPGRRQQKMYP
jgi:hypothetical protein